MLVRHTLPALALLLGACDAPSTPADGAAGDNEDRAGETAGPLGDAAAAEAALEPVGGGGVEGTVRLTDLEAGVRVVANVRGLGGVDDFHALHVLAATSCDDLDLEPAHFDPDGAPHGPFDAPPGARHAGDLGNLRAYDGAGRYDRVDHVLALAGPRSALGRAVVVRAGQDDGWSDTGNAGDVLACGILQ
jgi:Cu-Zn family superoxide dismutase